MLTVAEKTFGDYNVIFGAYCPRDALSQMYCKALISKIKEVVAGLTVEDLHDWIRDNQPMGPEILEYVANGGSMELTNAPGELPIDPKNARLEVPLVAYLKKRRALEGTANNVAD